MIGLVLAWSLGIGTASAVDQRTRVFEYLHVEANSGGSSGGHTAICFEENCFHFQQTEGAFLRIQKESAFRLDHGYRALDNRTIHAYRIEVAEETFEDLAEEFSHYYLVQERQFEVLESLREEQAFLESLLEARDNAGATLPFTAPLRLPGTAYFYRDGPSFSATPSREGAVDHASVLRRLERNLKDRYGEDCLDLRADSLSREIEALDPLKGVSAPPLPEHGRFDNRWTGFRDRYREAMSARLAVEALRWQLVLREEATWTSNRPAFDLDAGEIEFLRNQQTLISDRLVRLFSSRRPDWGYPMLVGLARLQALEASIKSRRLVLLDVFPENTEIVDRDVVQRHAGALSEISRERLEDFLAARQEVFDQSSSGEMSWSLLEDAGNRLMELDRALTDRTSMRVPHDHPIPAKSALRSDWLAPHPPLSHLKDALAMAKDRARVERKALRKLYRYDLVSRNCVTEIFRTMESALSHPGNDPDLAGQDHVGGTLHRQATLNFVPFISARAVSRHYGVDKQERPSYRRMALEHSRKQESNALVSLRESNVVTSLIYEWNGADGLFFFFTEETPYLRPLYGAVNLLAAGGATVLGVSLLPIDRGEVLRGALNGILFSVPEMFFVNLRKGSFPFAPYSWLRCLETPQACEANPGTGSVF